MKRRFSSLRGIWVPTACGKFYLEASPRGLYRLEFAGKGKSLQWRVPRAAPYSELAEAQRLLIRYFRGEEVSFRNLKIDYSACTNFEKKILRCLSKLPRGRVVSYRGLAEKVGAPGAARAVGSVMKKNRLPIILPCHRVIDSNGGLGGYSKGLAWKKRLLQLEKILPKLTGPGPFCWKKCQVSRG